MPRVGKARRLKRQGRIARNRVWLTEFWGPDWLAQRDAYLCTVQPRSAAHCGRTLLRNVRQAKARQALRTQATSAAGTGGTVETMGLGPC